MSDYQGAERRTANCDAHERNTEDIHAMKSAIVTIKWVVNAGLPLITLILGAYIGQVQGNINKSLDEIKADVNQVQVTIQDHALSSAPVRRQVEINTKRLDSLEENFYYDAPRRPSR
jgi:hypothetical protein